MTDVFETLVRKFGPPRSPKWPTAEQLSELEERVPQDLLAFWRNYGLGLWLHGKFQFCLPQRLVPVTQRIFFNDPQINPEETLVVGFSAFGELLAWNGQHQRILIDLPRLVVRAPKLQEEVIDETKPYPVATPLMRLDREGSFDVFEDTAAAEPLFERARRQLGELQPGECYGFAPALAFGGPARIDHLRKLDALVHFTILTDLGRCRLVRRATTGGAETTIRMIGG